MKVLITGSSGLIGSRLVRYYKSKGCDVYEHDIDDDWSDVAMQCYDIIHHCASICIIREVIANPKQMYWNNDITFKVLELARRWKPDKLYMYSSNRVSSEYENPYVTSKKFLENATKGYSTCYGIDYIIVRPETIWGYKKDDPRIISNWIEKAILGEDLFLYGDINKEISPLYVDDFIVQLLGLNYHENVGRTITITGTIRKAYEVGKTIIRVLRSTSGIVFKDAELAQPQRCPIRNDEIRVDTNLEKDIERYQNYKELFGS